MIDIQTILALIARHALTTAGGWLVSQGYLQSSGLDAFVGGGMIMAGVLWSWWQKTGQAEVLAELARLKAQKATLTSQAVQDAMAQNKS